MTRMIDHANELGAAMRGTVLVAGGTALKERGGHADECQTGGMNTA